MNSSKNKQEGGMIGAIVKFVIVWLWWWVAMPMVLHQWIYKRCCSWNLKRSEQKPLQSFSCFNVRLPGVEGSFFICCRWRQMPKDWNEITNLELLAISFASSRPLIPTPGKFVWITTTSSMHLRLKYSGYLMHHTQGTRQQTNSMQCATCWLIGCLGFGSLL